MAVVYGLCRVADPTIRYVGITSKTAKRRFIQHASNARKGRALPVYKWWRKYDDVQMVVLQADLTLDEAREIEKREIATRANLLNLTAGGEGLFNPSAETRARLSAASKGNTNKRGFKVTAETKNLIAAAQRGKPKSEQHRAKLSAALKGRPVAESVKIAASLTHKGKPKSEETKARMAAARRAYWERKRAETAAA